MNNSDFFDGAPRSGFGLRWHRRTLQMARGEAAIFRHSFWAVFGRVRCDGRPVVDPHRSRVLFQDMSNAIQMRTVPNRYASSFMLGIGMAAIYAISAVYWLYLIVACRFSAAEFRRRLGKA
jgi:hypothetical protein